MYKMPNKFNEIVYSIIQLSGVKQELALRAFNKYAPIVEDTINTQHLPDCHKK